MTEVLKNSAPALSAVAVRQNICMIYGLRSEKILLEKKPLKSR